MLEEKYLASNAPLPESRDGLDELRGVLFMHLNKYPLMDIQDAAKIVYQHEFGCAHLVKDSISAYTDLIDEYRSLVQRDLPLLESVGGGYARLDLRALKANGVELIEVYDWVLKTASDNSGSLEDFLMKLKVIREPWLGFDSERLERFFSYYKNSGYSPIHHSTRFVAAYSPAYRVIKAELARNRQTVSINGI